jgi:hypothetical protein
MNHSPKHLADIDDEFIHRLLVDAGVVAGCVCLILAAAPEMWRYCGQVSR